MTRAFSSFARPSAVLALIAVLAGCASGGPAPIEERGPAPKAKPAPAAATAVPGAAAAAGTYTVKPGDTLYKIAVDHSLDYRDLIKWNELDSSALIKVGQVLRLTPPDGAASAASTGVETAAVNGGSVESRPLGASPSEAPKPAAKPAESKVAAAKVAEPKAADSDVTGWIWPATGKVIDTFNDGKNKGVDIAGKAGDAVVAAADGKVVYSGAGLRGYGNLVIVKHTDNFLSAYAHNRSVLVSEGQQVKRGQKIAEMGMSDADRVKLHFEIRKQGTPVDPLKYLPER